MLSTSNFEPVLLHEIFKYFYVTLTPKQRVYYDEVLHYNDCLRIVLKGNSVQFLPFLLHRETGEVSRAKVLFTKLNK